MQNFISKTHYLLGIALMTTTCSTLAHEGDIPQKLFDNPPTEHSGLSVTGKNALKLGKQIPALNGYQVRVRTVTMEPGAIVKNHGHESRPGVFHVIKGEIAEIRGDKHKDIKAGQTVIEDYNTEHWVINNNKKEAVLFVFDIVPEE